MERGKKPSSNSVTSVVGSYDAIGVIFYKNKAGAVGQAVAIVVQRLASDRDLYTVCLVFIGAERSDKAAVGYIFSLWDF